MFVDSVVRSWNMTMVEGPPASSSTPLQTSVCYPSIRLLADIYVLRGRHFSIQISEPAWSTYCVSTIVSLYVLKWMPCTLNDKPVAIS